MDKYTLIIDTLIGLVVCIVGIILISTVFRSDFASISADISKVIQNLLK